MVRRYDEPIEVKAAATPQAFLWRGRLFVVREVLGRWQERRQWWRAGGGEAATDRERQVWRVEASAGRGARTGVFDLGLDGPDGWLLLRTHD